MSTLFNDLKFGFRQLRKTPGLTAIVILTLAVGISANTIVFSWISSMFFHPLPGVADTDRLVVVVERNPTGQDGNTVSYPDLRDLAAHNEVFAGAAGVRIQSILNMQAQGQSAWIWAQAVTPGLFAFLGVKPHQGRTFLPEEEGPSGKAPVVILSHKLWRKQFGSDPKILGKVIQLNRQSFTIVGVMPPQFKGTTNGLSLDLWMTVPMMNQLNFSSTLDDRSDRSYEALARLQPGVTLAQAQAATRAISLQLEAAYPDTNKNSRIQLFSLLKCPYGAQAAFIPLFNILLMATLLLLVIVAANIANLLLAQASSRHKEIAIRLTMGAGRVRLIRQFLVESILLAIAGGILGTLLSIWGIHLLSFFTPKTYLPIDLSALMQVNWQVLVYALAITLLTGFGFGMVPALQNIRPDLNSALKEGGRYSSGSSGSHRLGSLLVVAETALAVVVLIGAGLCCISFKKVLEINPGFDPKHLLLAGVQLSASEYDEDQGREFYRRVLEKLPGMAGVDGVSLSSWVQLGFDDTGKPDIEVEGYLPERQEDMGVRCVIVADNYLETMRIPLMQGRQFQPSDTRKSNKVVIVNETMAKRFWHGTTALGRRIKYGDNFYTVVGIAKDGKYANLKESPQPFMYFAFEQNYLPNMALHVRSHYDSPTLLAAIQKEIHAIDPSVSIAAAMPMLDVMDANYFAQRILATLLASLGLLALLLASLGIYGVLSWSVSRQLTEIGIRMSLGASRLDILKMVILNGSRLMLAGVVIGTIIAAFLSRHMAAFLVGVRPHDPLIFSTVCGFLLLIGMWACYLPARRAASVDPMAVLRGE
jgi:putative ABC transport system permease protein